MSGFVCPECMGSHFANVGQKLQCSLCGWIGENNGWRVTLAPQKRQENSKRFALVNAGKLFTVRVRYTGTPEDRELDISATMKILNVNGMGGTSDATETTYKVGVQTRPSDEELAQIRKLKTVKTVSVFP